MSLRFADGLRAIGDSEIFCGTFVVESGMLSRWIM